MQGKDENMFAVLLEKSTWKLGSSLTSDVYCFYFVFVVVFFLNLEKVLVLLLSGVRLGDLVSFSSLAVCYHANYFYNLYIDSPICKLPFQRL